jgi:hypothetical protein
MDPAAMIGYIQFATPIIVAKSHYRSVSYVIRLGMFSSRKYNVQRHVNDLHKGYGNIVSFVDYLLGRHWCIYRPNPRPTYQRKEVSKFDVMNEEFLKQIARESASKAVNSNNANYASWFSKFLGK